MLDTSATVKGLVWRGRVYSRVEYGWRDDQPFADPTPCDPDIVGEFLKRMKLGMPDALMPAFTNAARGGFCFTDDPNRGEP